MQSTRYIQHTPTIRLTGLALEILLDLKFRFQKYIHYFTSLIQSAVNLHRVTRGLCPRTFCVPHVHDCDTMLGSLTAARYRSKIQARVRQNFAFCGNSRWRHFSRRLPFLPTNKPVSTALSSTGLQFYVCLGKHFLGLTFDFFNRHGVGQAVLGFDPSSKCPSPQFLLSSQFAFSLKSGFSEHL